MASDNSFDVVSKVEMQEVKNAIDQASKEVNARFDLKDSKSKIELARTKSHPACQRQDEYTLKAVIEILSQKLVKRGVSLKNLEYEKVEPAANSSVRQKIKLKQGVNSDAAKKIVAAIKDSKMKAQASIQGDTVRVVSRTGCAAADHGQAARGRLRSRHCSSPTTARPSSDRTRLADVCLASSNLTC